MSQDDRNQEKELYNNGTLCYKCGNLIEDLIGDDRILKTASNKKNLCEECTNNGN